MMYIMECEELMKNKLFRLLLVSLMTVSLAGCGNKETETKTEETGTEAVAGEEAGAEEGSEASEESVEQVSIYFKDIAVDDYVTLGEYKGLEVLQSKQEVTQQDVDNFIHYTLEGHSELQPITDRDVVENGDTANIDYEGKKDGVAFDGGTAQGQDLVIGSGTFIPGFEEGLVGVKVGETVDLDLTFPEEYHSEELAGQKVVFTVTVNSISRHVDPELTDEFVAGLGIEGISTVAEFQEYAKQGLEDQALEDFNYNVKMQVLTLVMNNAQIQEPPAELVEKYKNVTNSQMEYQASMYGVDLETFVNAYFGMDLAAYETEVAAGALETAKQALVCYKIALEENLIATEEELNSYIEENYASMGYASAEAFKETVDLQEYADSLLIDNVLTFLAENAAVTEAGSALQ